MDDALLPSFSCKFWRFGNKQECLLMGGWKALGPAGAFLEFLTNLFEVKNPQNLLQPFRAPVLLSVFGY